jgi:tripartite-type tricarboxylate transporter receptor subunit TctC
MWRVVHVFGWVVCAAVMAAAAVTPAAAQQWKPTKTVELVVGSAPGGSPDIMARLIQNIFQKTGLVAA